MERDSRWVVTLRYEDSSIVRVPRKFDTHRGAQASAMYYERTSWRGPQPRNGVVWWEICQAFMVDPC